MTDSRFASFKDVIAAWPSAAALAGDLNIPSLTVRQWRNRDAIPGTYWADVEVAAARRSFSEITVNLLAQIAAAKREPLPARAQAAAQ